MRVCEIDGCNGAHQGHGLCGKHYLRAYHRGELPPRVPRPSLAERLWKFVEKSPTGCWLWTGSLDRKGYGRSYIDGRNTGAHSAMYRLIVGEIPEGLELDHLCHTPACVNPSHLEPVTHAENIRRARPRRKQETCRNGHDRTDLPNGAPCPVCKAQWQLERRRALRKPQNTTQHKEQVT